MPVDRLPSPTGTVCVMLDRDTGEHTGWVARDVDKALRREPLRDVPAGGYVEEGREMSAGQTLLLVVLGLCSVGFDVLLWSKFQAKMAELRELKAQNEKQGVPDDKCGIAA